MSILAIDFGTKRIGLAVSSGVVAEPLKVLPNNNKIFQNLKDICEKLEVDKIVIGLPEGTSEAKVVRFAKILEKLLKVKIEFEPEMETTKKATQLLIAGGVHQKKRKKIIDKATAAVILQDYLNRQE